MSIVADSSTVEYYDEHEGYRCGYCKSPNTNYSHGMWAHSLTVHDYQNLIDRGWRRSGCYCYKPQMHVTCCPMYTIKCSVLDFKLSKSQKKKLKRFHNFLAYGKSKSIKEEKNNESSSDAESGDDAGTNIEASDFPGLKEKAERAFLNIGSAIVNTVESSIKERLFGETAEKIEHQESSSTSLSSAGLPPPDVNKHQPLENSISKKYVRPGEGVDPSRPQCKKAKLLRLERKAHKLLQTNSSTISEKKIKTVPVTKSLEDFINEPLPDSPAHKLEVRLVRSCPVSKEFKSTFKNVLEVYQRYQMAIHNDPIEKVKEKQFTRFLVNSPLKIKLVNVSSPDIEKTLMISCEVFAKYQMAVHGEAPDECDLGSFRNFLIQSPLKPWKPKDGPPQGYGSFHQQYWLDGRLIAVGVIDILPKCVSSVYFFYDPEFHFLVLGTYGSLREISFCRSLHHTTPNLRYYYMGFYIHSCPKMRYKGAFSPSFLLCPEVYTWHPIEYCITKLEKNKYCRFNEDVGVKDEDQVDNVEQVLVIFQNELMYYKQYLLLNKSDSHLEEVTRYAGLVGNKLAKRMLLVLT